MAGSMGKNIMNFLTIYFLCGVLRVITCASTTVREGYFSKKTGVLYQSSYSGPEMTSCSGRPCKATYCAVACMEEAGCVVYSHNKAKAKCILSSRPNNDLGNHETSNSEWNTYYTGCPVQKGYVLYTSHQPPLCLRVDKRHVLKEVAKSVCRQEQADLVRVKTLAIYDTVKDLLTNAGFTDNQFVYIGAEDTAVEGQFVWNDGTAVPAQGTALWRTGEGYNDNEDCLAIAINSKFLDTLCAADSRAFVCQYDV